ncbi:hypothetical protein B0T24DRAFT_589929 [Lasiosphaeria ovina]|uniref:Uncharacterized protein n=1 Tax=Lasiosphaeria ovina TaxID=92902 RepID=A0AAE0KMU4_9PEZI|nr:hypothetical protein B0T24DRAFT_589929 [Lasiosphaeria ovina]
MPHKPLLSAFLSHHLSCAALTHRAADRTQASANKKSEAAASQAQIQPRKHRVFPDMTGRETGSPKNDSAALISCLHANSARQNTSGLVPRLAHHCHVHPHQQGLGSYVLCTGPASGASSALAEAAASHAWSQTRLLGSGWTAEEPSFVCGAIDAFPFGYFAQHPANNLMHLLMLAVVTTHDRPAAPPQAPPDPPLPSAAQKEAGKLADRERCATNPCNMWPMADEVVDHAGRAFSVAAVDADW